MTPDPVPEPDWLRKFLKRYIQAIAPHDWPDGTIEGEWDVFIEGWSHAFADANPPVTEEEADAARIRLAMAPPSFRRDHLPAVLAVVRGFRERDAAAESRRVVAADPLEARATARSRGCPECGGTGWARRKGVWLDRSWSATATLYCRCSLGRLRRDLEPDDPPPFDDLQAMPHLWDWSKGHITWTERPEPPPSVEGRQWWYLAPGEPEPMQLPCVPPPTGKRSGRANRSWSGPIPANLFMPRLIQVDPPIPPQTSQEPRQSTPGPSDGESI